jgi:RNA recognition motif-containing protein
MCWSETTQFDHTRSNGSNTPQIRAHSLFALDVREKHQSKGNIVNNILVGNLSPSITERDIRSLFAQHGVVRKSKLMTDRWTGLSRGFGFIQMKADAAAPVVIAALDGTDLNGKSLKIRKARPQLHRRTDQKKA